MLATVGAVVDGVTIYARLFWGRPTDPSQTDVHTSLKIPKPDIHEVGGWLCVGLAL